jgi:hypothetical protein
MRQFAQVRPGFWTGPTGKQIRKLGLECQVIALYLITGPMANALGLYYLPLPMASHEIGLTVEKIRKSLQQLREIGFCEYDEESESVFIPNMARFQIAERLKNKDKQVTWVWRELEKLRNNPFFDRFLDIYGERYQIGAYFRPEGPAKPLGSIETETRNLEREREIDTRQRAGEGGGVERGNQPTIPTGFEHSGSRLDMNPFEAQQILLDRRLMAKKAEQKR